MDTSQKYIKMCEKAEEIQKGWKPEPFMDLVVKKCDGVYCCLGVNFEGHYTFGGVARIDLKNVFWLPRQDQLQEISGCTMPMILTYFYNYIWDNHYQQANGVRNGHYTCRDMSMEQLWLSFVMQRKYSKVWDNEKEEWIEYKVVDTHRVTEVKSRYDVLDCTPVEGNK